MEIKQYFGIIISTILISSVLISCNKEWHPLGDYKGDETTNPVIPPVTPEEEENWTEVNDKLSIGEIKIIDQPDGTFFKGYWPDGKLIPIRKGNEWQLFWCEGTDALTVGHTPYPEDHINLLKNDSKIWGKDFSRIDGFNDGGSWFIGIFPLDKTGKYVGFFHAESHWDGSGVAHKSIGVVYSDDFGKTWHDPEPIIVDKTLKPESPDWTGLGDGCVIWDKINSRYICYYQGKIAGGSNTLCMAASSDKEGKSGSWKKWDGNDFTIPAYDKKSGIGGENIPIKNLLKYPGANPSVMWNSFLNKWVMVYASWAKRIYMSFSNNGISWTTPEKILGDMETPVQYANMIGENGDLEGGEIVKLYWSHKQNSIGIRDIGYARIKFSKK